MKKRSVIIMGAAGRDFHNFNMVYRADPGFSVKAFTAAQIPFTAGRTYPAELAGPLYSSGIPIRPEEELASLIRSHDIDQVVFSYSDISHIDVMHKACLCLSLGADFVLLGPDRTMLRSSLPVVSVCAVRTGCGKTGVTRYVLRALKKFGSSPVAIRHPMPYCELAAGSWRRYATKADLAGHRCSIEEREEFEPIVSEGGVVYAGIDYTEVLRHAEEEADVIVWDGGNNDLPFIRSDLEIVVFDPHRPGHELLYYPGEANARRAQIAVVNKADTADPEGIRTVEENIRRMNPEAVVVHTASRIAADRADAVRGRKVLVVEDGPTLTHGGMTYGAGLLAARMFAAGEVVDPRPYAAGSLREVFGRYPQIGKVLPAMGYSAEQIEELKETIERTECDVVLVATPIDLTDLLGLKKETVRISYEVEELEGTRIRDALGSLRHGRRR